MSTSLQTPLNQQHALTNGVQTPEEGPLEIPAFLDFTGSFATVDVDFSQPMKQKRITGIQTLKIHNRDNPSDLLIEIDGTQEILTVSANTDVCLPILAGNLAVFHFTTTPGAGIIIPVYFINIMLPAYQLGLIPVAASISGAVSIAGAVSVQGSVSIAGGSVSLAGGSVSLSGGTATVFGNVETAGDGTSSIIAASGSPQVALAGTIGAGSFITNPNTAVGSLFVDMVHAPSTVAPGVSGTTVELVPGQTFTFPRVSNSASVAGTKNQTFTAVRLTP